MEKKLLQNQANITHITHQLNFNELKKLLLQLKEISFELNQLKNNHMKILITGCNGFVASNLIAHLKRKPDVQLLLFSKKHSLETLTII